MHLPFAQTFFDSHSLYFACSKVERDPQLVSDDITDGLVSLEMAHDNYGVVIDQRTNEIDLVATQELRTILREQRLNPAK
jgi:hypothetical protein